MTTTQAIVDTSVANGGGTFRNTGEAVTDGIAVGWNTLYTGPTLDDTEVEFATLVADVIGTWYDQENQVWEIQETVIFRTREVAFAAARSLGERYVYDLTTDECVAVPAASTSSN